MKITRNFRYKESLPVEERESYRTWKKEHDNPKSIEDRKQVIRKNNIDKNVYLNVKLCIRDIYEYIYKLCENSIYNVSHQEFEEDITLNTKLLENVYYDDDFIKIFECSDYSGSDNDFVLAVSNFRQINNAKDLFLLSPKNTHILLIVGDNLLTNLRKLDYFDPDFIIEEIIDNLGLSRRILSSVYDSLLYIDNNLEKNVLDGVGPAYSIIDFGSILDIKDNFEDIRDSVLALYLVFKNNTKS